MLTVSALTHVLYVPIAQSLFTFHRLKIECEKLASEKTEMQRHYVMVRHFVSSFSRLFIFSQHAHPCLLKDRLPRVAFQLSIILLRTRHIISREMDESGGKDLEQQHPEGISRISTKASAYCEIIDKGRG